MHTGSRLTSDDHYLLLELVVKDLADRYKQNFRKQSSFSEIRHLKTFGVHQRLDW